VAALSWPANGPIGEWLLQTSGAFRLLTALAPPARRWRLELLEEEALDWAPPLQARARHWRGPGA